MHATLAGCHEQRKLQPRLPLGTPPTHIILSHHHIPQQQVRAPALATASSLSDASTELISSTRGGGTRKEVSGTARVSTGTVRTWPRGARCVGVRHGRWGVWVWSGLVTRRLPDYSLGVWVGWGGLAAHMWQMMQGKARFRAAIGSRSLRLGFCCPSLSGAW